MQISDSGFRGEVNVVNPGDSAKRASPGRRAGFSNVNAILSQTFNHKIGICKT